jgi:hypothetical protein
MRTSYVTKSKWINEKERHRELDGDQNKEHDTHSIANRISSLVSSALGKNATEIDAMTNEKIDDIKRLYDNDKKKQIEEIKLLKDANKKMLEDIQKIKTDKANFLPINPANYQMVVVDKKETKEDSKEKEKTITPEKKEEVKKELPTAKEPTEEDKKELERNRYMEEEKYNEVRDYFTKVQKYILNDKRDDDKIRTFLKGELSEIVGILEQVDSDENSSSLKYEQVYKYFIKLTNKVTDEYIKTNFKEIKFTLDPTNNGNIPINMKELFVISFERFCYPLIEEIQKEEKEEDKIEVD